MSLTTFARHERLRARLGWVWSYFTFDVGVRLITEARESSTRRGS